MKHSMFVCVAMGAVLGACTEITDTATINAALEDYARNPRCDDWGCGANSATVGDGVVFDELDATGSMPSRNGAQIAGVYVRGTMPGKLYVRRQEIHVDVDGVDYHGEALIDTIIKLDSPEGGYELKIVAYDEKSLRFWRGAPDIVPFYDIRVRNTYGEFKESICRNSVASEDPRWAAADRMVIAFQWDHYDPKTKQVFDLPDDTTWFNLACAGTAPAKLHLQRHTRAGAYHADNSYAPEYYTTTDLRQTMLKMYTADYCGSGVALTVDGTPLNYGDAYGWIPFRGGTTEALWTPYGAACLDTPRLAWPMATIWDICGFEIPRCGDTSAWWSRAYLISAVPGAPGPAPSWTP